jgi:serine/threonine protein kinase
MTTERPPDDVDIYATRPGAPLAGSRLPGGAASGRATDPLALRPGDVLDDFQVIDTLGRGGFGTVYRAWQLSLGRQIALKVSACAGQEGRTLARLDHPHIVSVYAESVRDGLRLLCMQYVPSLALDDLLRQLTERPSSWTGTDLLAVIDRSHTVAADFDPAQLADRQELAGLDHVDAVCFIGSRLADALGHAHRQGVLHRDIKAGNVLVSQYGRPLLVDFNMAETEASLASGESMFGGTLPYMAPEHIDAFNPGHAASTSVVTAVSDQYSLGVLVYELATGRLPFPCESFDGGIPFADVLTRMAAARREPHAVWDDPLWRREPGLAAVLRRALAPEPADRWPSTESFAAALRETSELRRAVVVATRSDPLPDWCTRHPFATLVLAAVLPNMAGSAVNIPYNLLRIVPTEHEPTFFMLVNVYNLLVYPICTTVFVAITLPVYRGWRDASRLSAGLLEDLRGRVVRWPRWAAWMAVMGWLPAVLFFPWALHRCDYGLGWSQIGHFMISIALSGMIALTYSMLAVTCLVAWIFYPRLWGDPAGFGRRAAAEVSPLFPVLRVLPLLAGAIPLTAAILMVTASPRSFSEGEYESFRLLTTTLIALGMVGFHLAVKATGLARTSLAGFMGPLGHGGEKPVGR